MEQFRNLHTRSDQAALVTKWQNSQVRWWVGYATQTCQAQAAAVKKN